jgi:hypothetical protein
VVKEMVIVWILLAVVVVALIAAAVARTRKRWALIVSESGARVDRIDRLEAFLKSRGMKSRITREPGGMTKLFVRQNDVEGAKALLERFTKEG